MPDGTPLPAFRGARAVDEALAYGAAWFGASVHRVGLEVDRGEVMVRAPLSRIEGETRETLFERIHAVERRILIEAIERWIDERRDGA
jgi:phosphoribosylglycinamide formyltransferase-1